MIRNSAAGGRRPRRRVAAVLALALAAGLSGLGPAAADDPPDHAVQDLGVYGAPGSVSALAASGSTVVGKMRVGTTEHAFAYSLETGVTTDLGTLDGQDTQATLVTGSIVAGVSGGRGFELDLADGVMHDLGTFGGIYNTPTAIDSGVVVGASTIAGASYATHAYAYRVADHTVTDLGTLGGDYSSALGVWGNWVVGEAQIPGEWVSHAFAYSLETGVRTDLGTLGGRNSTARAVWGDTVVGDAQLDGDITHAFVYSLGTGQMTDLGAALGGIRSSATAVSGDYVTGTFDPDNVTTEAFAYNVATHTLTKMPMFHGDNRLSNVVGVTQDGTVCGNSWTNTDGHFLQPWLYNVNTGTFSALPALATPDTQTVSSGAKGVDPDGNVVVGSTSLSANVDAAVAWVPSG